MTDTPFGSPVTEVPLARTPLVFVVAQARFERLASISSEAFISGFQEAIRPIYPVMRREQQASILVGPDGRIVTGDGGTTLWRFEEQPGPWQVTLAPDSVAISTTTYTSRTDFIGRLMVILEAAQRELNLRFCDRLGIRYVDQLTDENLLERLPTLVKPQVMGAAGAARLDDGEITEVHFFSDATYQLPDSTALHARWGLLPEQATFDPAIPTVQTRSWVLDLDAYTREQERFDPQNLTRRAERLCERIYRYFRWVVDDAFLVAHGGQP